MSTQYKSQNLTVGMIVLERYIAISELMQLVGSDISKSRELYGALLSLDAVLINFRDKMFFENLEQDKKRILKYDAQIKILVEKKNKLRFSNVNDITGWQEWGKDYLDLLCSCFNLIGLTPPKTFGDFKNMSNSYE